MTQPTMYQRWKAPNDTNGNPRRVFLVFDAEGNVLDVIDEGYAGRPGWLRGLIQLPDVHCFAHEYRDWLRQAAVTP